MWRRAELSSFVRRLRRNPQQRANQADLSWNVPMPRRPNKSLPLTPDRGFLSTPVGQQNFNLFGKQQTGTITFGGNDDDFTRDYR